MTTRLITLGELRCYHDRNETDLPKQKLRFALLVYLAMERNVSREKVATLLWPEIDTERARHRLTQSIYAIGQTLGKDWLESRGEDLRATDDLVIDAREFGKLTERGDYGSALALYNGPFLDGFYVDGAPEWEHWADRKRAMLQRNFAQAARAQAASAMENRQYTAALQLAARWLELDELDEDAHRLMMEALAGSGLRSDALAHFNDYERQLRASEGEEVPPALRSLAAEIRASMMGPAATSPVAAALAPAPASGDESFSSPSKSRKFDLLRVWAELKRRRVVHVASVYAAAAFIIIQAASVVLPALRLPDWTVTFVVVLALLGFPAAVILSWVFDLTPEGELLADRSTAADRASGTRIRVSAPTLALYAAALMVVTGATTIGIHRLIKERGVAALCADGSAPPCDAVVAMDEDSYVVLPLAHAQGTEPALLDGELCARLLTEGMARWQDVKLADAMRVNDALQRHGPRSGERIPVDSGIAIARRVGSGRLVMGELWHYRDTTRVRATVYDVVHGGRVLRTAQTRFEHKAGGQDAFTELADDLLVPGTQLRASGRPSIPTTSLVALLDADKAFKALNSWKLDSAAYHFRLAVERDPAFARGHFWLAQTLMWAGDTAQVWRSHASSAFKFKEQLSATDGLLASAMAVLSNQRYPEACALYRQVLARDSLSFAAWMGLGDCQAWDRIVIRDAKSPSGYAFRGSQHSAVLAYERASALVPSFNFAFRNVAATRLGRALYVAPSRFRAGHLAEADTVRFAAWPGLDGDTVAFIPHPRRDAMLGLAGTTPANLPAAIAWNQAKLRDATIRWVRAFAESAEAHTELALVLELMGMIRETRSSETSALTAVRRARQLATDPDQQLSLAIAEVRLIFKNEDFNGSAARARSLLREWPSPTPAQAERLAALAALTGQVHTMAELLRRSAPAFDGDVPITGEVVKPPQPVVEAALRSFAYAAIGAPLDSLRVLTRRAHDLLAGSVPASQLAAMHTASTLDRVDRMVFSLLGPQDVHRGQASGNPFIALQRLIIEGDSGAVRAELARGDTVRQSYRPGDLSIDYVLFLVETSLAVGDTAGAIRRLDPLLAALWTVAPSNFNDAHQPASLVRLMATRAELASRANDLVSARRWASAVVTLWSRADRELRPMVDRMRKLDR